VADENDRAAEVPQDGEEATAMSVRR